MPLITPQKLSRRDFLNLTWKGLVWISGILGLVGFLRFLDFQSEPATQTQFDLGTPDRYPTGTHIIIPEAQAVLFNQGGELIVFSLVCTHLGCLVNVVSDGFACPCHGSRFDQNGNVRRGPATKALRLLTLESNDKGHLILSTKD